MRAPVYAPTFTPVEAYHARFTAPVGPTPGTTVGNALIAGKADLLHLDATRAAIQAVTDDTAGRARAVQDRAAMLDLVANHAGLQGGAAVAAQPSMLGELARIRADGQADLATPDMAAAYDAQIRPAFDDASGRITSHALNQALVERQALAELTLRDAQNSAAADWRDPGRFVQGLGTVQSLAATHAGPAASDTDRTAAVRGAVGGTVAQALGQALTAGEPEFAAHIIGGWGGSLSPAAYQLAVARVSQARQNQRMAAVFSQAAGGNPPDNPTTNVPPDNAVAIPAPVGAAVYPIAGGTVTAIDGAPDNASIRITHPDGSDATYGGIGLAAVAPGNMVTPRHVIGSAGPAVTLQIATPTGAPDNAAATLQSAGGPAAMIGTSDAPRIWDPPTLIDRIAARQDLSEQDRALAANLGQRRMALDQTRLAENDLAAGRTLATMASAAPGQFGRAEDLPVDLAANLTPTTLANVDTALRGAAQTPFGPATDNPTSLRLELLQRRSPGQFAQVNLAPMVGAVHPGDLVRLAQNQAAIVSGQGSDDPADHRSAVLDAMARHEFITGEHLPDTILPVISDQATTLLRLNQTEPTDRQAIGAAVADAIQSQRDQP